MATLKTLAEAKDAAEQAEKLKKRAARQAAKVVGPAQDVPTEECTVLPLGDGKISMGQHVGGLGEAHYEEGETFTVELPIALDLYERGYVNFEGAKEKLAERKERRKYAAMEAAAEDMAMRKMVEAAEARLSAR